MKKFGVTTAHQIDKHYASDKLQKSWRNSKYFILQWSKGYISVIEVHYCNA